MKKTCDHLFAWLGLTLLGLTEAANVGAAEAPTVAADKPRMLRVVLDRNYPPYSFQADDGRMQGILVDQWHRWEEKTGIKVDLRALDWADALAAMRTGDFDVIDSVVQTATREQFLDFTPPVATIDVAITFRKEISGIVDLASLKGFPVGVKSGAQQIELLRASGVDTLLEFPSDDAVVAAARDRKVNVFVVTTPSAFYYLHKAGIADEFRQTAPLWRNQLRRAVRKGDDRTLRTVTAGFAALDPIELQQIEEKWFGRAITRGSRYLTYAGVAGAATLLVVAGLMFWNRVLRDKLRRGTVALRESERRFRQIAENIHDVVWLTTADLRTLYVSPRCADLWGVSRESLQRDHESFLRAIHPDDRLRVAELLAREREQRFEVQYRVRRPDGSVRWIWDRGFPIRDEAGRVYRVARIAKDITERHVAAELMRQAENRIRLLIDTIPTTAWSVEPDGKVDFLNRQWLDYTGLSLAAALVDSTQVMHPADLAAVLAKWGTAMAAGEPFEAEMRLRRADGVYRWFLTRTVPFRDEQGRIVKWFGASVDIEDRKRAEESMQARRRQLRALVERLHKAREEEARRIARELHDELGQQLTALNLQLDSLDADLVNPTPEQRAQIDGLHRIVGNTIRSVQSIAGELRLGQLDVLGLTAAVDWQLQEFSRRYGIVCDVLRLDEITGLSDAQNTAVFRILQEALTNIVRHARATRVAVSLQASPERVVLKVHDNGRGITPAELIDHRAIGLLGMHERAEIVGGTVAITGAPGLGTTVLVIIPRLPRATPSA